MLFGKQAETAAEYVKKGQMVYVEGRLNTREWEDQNQIKRKTTEIRCDNFTMLGRRGDSTGSMSNPATKNPEAQGTVPSESINEDDDLPF